MGQLATASCLASLRARLEVRHNEIEQALLARIYGVAAPSGVEEPEYLDGVRAAVSAILSYGLSAIERGEERAGPPPPVVLAQTRLAARSGVSLDTVLRCYFAGYTLLGDFLNHEAERDGLVRGASLQRVVRAQAALFDRLVVAITEEYRRVPAGHLRTTADQRRVELVRRLLASELVDIAELTYEFANRSHLGVVAVGPGAARAIRELAERLDRRLLLVRPDREAVWAWLGGRREVSTEEIDAATAQRLPEAVSLALGEPGDGIPGWRLTHRQARAALPVALRGEERLVRYSETALLASVVRDDLLATSLREIYLAPLAD